MNTIQKTIRYNVNKETNKVISNQSDLELSTVMRSIFLTSSDSSVPSNFFLSHLQDLNKQVVDFSVPQITTQLTQYDGYIKKLSQLPTPIDRPQQVDKNNFTYNMDNLM